MFFLWYQDFCSFENYSQIYSEQTNESRYLKPFDLVSLFAARHGTCERFLITAVHAHGTEDGFRANGTFGGPRLVTVRLFIFCFLLIILAAWEYRTNNHLVIDHVTTHQTFLIINHYTARTTKQHFPSATAADTQSLSGKLVRLSFSQYCAQQA